jgi:hypothetical protein
MDREIRKAYFISECFVQTCNYREAEKKVTKKVAVIKQNVRLECKRCLQRVHAMGHMFMNILYNFISYFQLVFFVSVLH